MMIVACITFAASVISAWAGSTVPATLVGCGLVFLGVLLFCVGSVLMVVDAASDEPVWTDVDGWRND